MTSPELSELDYLREIERLANRVKVEASNEGWLSFQADPEESTPLQRSVNALARTLRSCHFEGDGCTEENRPLVRLVPTRSISGHPPGRTVAVAGRLARVMVANDLQVLAALHNAEPSTGTRQETQG
ncbi:hypothetical protein [Streptomyces sp. NPDC001652]|uniref:hypothetical protein n=1 Tax=Streptomyces sp. NPDC001652 TaxID=3154393 RepID=UPI00332EC654